MPRLDDLKTLVIEPSSKCTANCPFCSRKQKARPFPDQIITLDDYKLLPKSIFSHLRQVSFAGNFGDFNSNPEMTEIAAYTREANPELYLCADTNGSARDESWWRELGKSFTKGFVVFALDGLGETNRVYRRGTDFDKIIRNMKAFISGGGVAYWKFIAFEHNEHQIEAAEKMAEECGCSRFFVIASRDYDRDIRPPKNLEFTLKREMIGSYWSELEDEKIKARCKPFHNRSIYIAADGSVHPCCFSHCMYVTEYNDIFRFIIPIIEKWTPKINFKTTPLREIVEGPYFNEILEQAATNKYCKLKCNKHSKEIKAKLILREKYMNGGRPV